MLLEVFDSIINLFGQASEFLGLSWLSVIGLSLMLLTVVVSFIVTQFSIEMKTARAVNKVNKYLELNPFITDENLVEFNKLMKHIPAPMRLQWQQFMVNRDKKPSEFFTEHNCIEKPFKTSAYASQLVAVKVSTVCLSILLFLFGSAYFVRTNNATFSFSSVLSCVLVPGVIALVGALYSFFLRSRRNSTLSDLYYNFADYQKYMDRACNSLPEYVDYEILFTRKEIVSGIPVLQEYLRQRALYEQEQINKAKESQVQHEHYDFSSLGINGSLIMEKSMEQCEFFTGNRKRIEAEISNIQGEKDILQRQNDEKNKTTQRKLRDIQESLDRLKEKLDATTSMVLSNDLRKQRENEVQKQRQLEKESAEQTKKYDDDRKKLDEQIAAKREELEQIRKQVEETIIVEFKLYADKIYEELKGLADEKVKADVDALTEEKVQLQQELEEKEKLFIEKSTVCDEKNELISEYEKQLAEKEEQLNNQVTPAMEGDELSNPGNRDREIFEVKKQLQSRNIELDKKNKIITKQREKIKKLKKKKRVYMDRFIDWNGNEFFYDEDGKAYYLDEDDERIYFDVEAARLQNHEQEGQAEENVEQVAGNEEQLQNFEESEMGLGFTDEDIKATLQVEPEPEPVEEKKEPEFHKPVYDFHWENSNANPDNAEQAQQASKDAEPNAEEKPLDETLLEDLKKEEAPVETEKLEEPAEEELVVVEPEETEEEPAVVEEVKPEEPAEEADELEELDKLIAEQNAELERQNQNLSKQLEDTKKVAEEEPKVIEEKKPAKKKPANKKSSNKKKEVANKSTKKKEEAKKAEEKKEKEKREQQAQQQQQFDFNLDVFNQQLQNAINDIDKDE